MTKVSVMLFTRNVFVQCFSAIFPTALCWKVSTTFFRRKNLLQIKIPSKNLSIFWKIPLICTGRTYGQRKHLTGLYSGYGALIFGRKNASIWNPLNLFLFFRLSRFCINQQPQMVKITSRVTITCSKSATETPDQYCVKYAQIPTSSEQYFPVFGQNCLRIRESIRIRESRYFGIFHLFKISNRNTRSILHEICANTDFLWAVFSRVGTESYPYQRKYTDHRKSVFWHISHCARWGKASLKP